MKKSRQTVAVIGASPNPERYSHKAIKRLLEFGHRVIPVNPAYSEIAGIPVVATMTQAATQNSPEKVETVCLYLSRDKLVSITDEIISIKPGRVIFNPGTEFPEFQSKLDKAGIPWIEACVLVLLTTGQF